MVSNPAASASLVSPDAGLQSPPPDVIRIRGVDLPLDRLVAPELLDAHWQQEMHRRLMAARPFPHLVLENLFDPQLLNLVHEDFDAPQVPWQTLRNDYENTRRSQTGAALGPAAQLYFSLVHAGWFTAALSRITGIANLVTDPLLWGGGLHESGAGAHFAVHRDFAYHRQTGLRNEMVLITYLNRHWQDAWGGQLELWDAAAHRCEATVAPVFGRSLLFLHGPRSFHGHPVPMTPPPGVTRRSVAVYYYTGGGAQHREQHEVGSVFHRRQWHHRLLDVARRVAPPVLWTLARDAIRGPRR